MKRRAGDTRGMMETKKPTFYRRFANSLKDRTNDIQRAFREFLAFPTLIILIFILLAAATYLVERNQYQIPSPIFVFFRTRIFVDAEATSNLLGNIAGSIITVTSITITLLLLIVQQSASNLTTQVFDQFLRRRSNQFYFGYFIGAAVFTLLTLATVDEPFNPVFSASLVFFFTIIALFLLMVLFYATIHQMRPPVILGAIHDHALAARGSQRKLISRTRRQSLSLAPHSLEVRYDHHGFVTRIDLDELEDVLKFFPAVNEIILTVSVGNFVAYQSRVAEIKLLEEGEFNGLMEHVRGAIELERSRDIVTDAAYAVTQLEQIAWTVLSPSKSNLSPGLQVIHLLRDLLSRWAEDARETVEAQVLPIVYNDDVIGNLIQAYESLPVIAMQSREHQVISVMLESISSVYPQLPDDWRDPVESALLRLLPTLDAHLLTSGLEQALDKIIKTLKDDEREETAARFEDFLARKQENPAPTI